MNDENAEKVGLKVQQAYMLHRLIKGDENALDPVIHNDEELLEFVEFMGTIGTWKDAPEP